MDGARCPSGPESSPSQTPPLALAVDVQSLSLSLAPTIAGRPCSSASTMMRSADESLQDFVSNQKRLLELELRAEEDAAVVKNDDSQTQTKDDVTRDGGFILRNIDLIDTSVGLYGRTVVVFGNFVPQQSIKSPEDSTTASSKLLQAHRLTVGDDVQILPNNGKGFQGGKKSQHAGGVICAVDNVSISVALYGGNAESRKQQSSDKKQGKKASKEDDEPYDYDGAMLGGNPPYALIPKSNIEVHEKMMMALDELAAHGVSHPVAGDIVMAAFESDNPKHNTEITRSRIEALESEYNLSSSRLDYSQREAVVMALHSNSPIYLIHGPPGTGKTTTVAELIRCAVHCKDWKVLVTAPSNVAVDNVLDRVMSIEHGETGKKKSGSKKKIKAVRLGHPARIQHGIQKYSLESLVQSSEGTEIVRDCRSELKKYLKTLSSAKSRPTEKRVAYKEMKALRKEIRSREEKVVGQILRESNVVLATNVGAASSLLHRMLGGKRELSFDLVIIDEAAQALEASCWISLLKGKRAVLAGDHKQLPPTIKCSAREVQLELGRTLFERLMLAYDTVEGGRPSCRSKMLEVQYRMHQDISDWASNAMYKGKLISHVSVKDRELATLPLVAKKMKTQGDSKEDNGSLENVTLILIDTTGCDMHEAANRAGSRYNEGEANIVVSHVQSLLSMGLMAEDIAVITPYNGQVELLRKMLLPDVPKLEIRSVDGFQGGEREAVVISLVRSSDRGGQDGIGFLRDKRRLNVAVTRSKRHCAVICDTETVTKDKFIKDLVDWMEKKGEYRSGAEYAAVTLNDGSDAGLQGKNIVPAAKVQQQTTHKEQPKKLKGELASRESMPSDTTDLTMKRGSTRIELMETINSFSESGNKGEKMNVFPSSDYDCVVARESAKQLGLGCRDSEGPNELIIEVLNGTKADLVALPAEETHTTSESKFAQLDVDDESSEETSNDGVEKIPPNNDLLRELAMEREKRLSEQLKSQTAKPPAAKKKKKKGNSKGQKLSGAKKNHEKDINDELEDLDDMAFLNVQIEKVQTSHGRKIVAKGKEYRSVVNGILTSAPLPREEPKRNGAASLALQAKLKSKEEDRKVKKKPNK